MYTLVILIMTLGSNTTTSMVSIPGFKTEAACKIAYSKFVYDLDSANIRIKGSCGKME